MYKEPRPMQEIHAIQEKLYEEMKHLSRREKVAHLRQKAVEAKTRWGLNLPKASPAV